MDATGREGFAEEGGGWHGRRRRGEMECTL